MSDQPYAVFLSRHLQRMCHLIVLLHLKAASELKHFQLWVQPERGWVWNNTFWDIWVWKLLLYQERKKKHAVFLLCHIVVLTVIFNMWWLCAKENEGLVSRRSRAQLTLLRLIHCRLCWCLRERDIWFCTHWFPMCHVLFFFFLRGGGGGGVVPQLQMWNFNLTFSVVTLTPMSKCGWLNLLERWLFLQERGVLLTLVYLSPPNPSLHIHWRSQSVAMWQLFLDQNNYVQSY